MDDLIAYHKVIDRGRYSLRDGLFWAASNRYTPNAGGLIGGRVWLVQGDGRHPVDYALIARFVVDAVEEHSVAGFSHTFVGEIGTFLEPGIDLGSQAWFPRFLGTRGNFSTGMGKINNRDVVGALEELLELRQRVDGFQEVHDEEIEGNTVYLEGAKNLEYGDRYERNRLARLACIEHHGAVCAACRFDFEQMYGIMGRGYIHVHHIRPISYEGVEHAVDPINDLIPVCPNCHAMLHQSDPPMPVEDLIVLLRSSGHLFT